MIQGIHHLTFKAGEARRTWQFYNGVLGLQLVKHTIRYEAPEERHLYFGDEKGSPGTLLSAWVHAGYRQGAVGKGQFATAALSIPMGAVAYWEERLAALEVPAKYPQQRGEEVVIYLEDPDGLGLELVANEADPRPGIASAQVPGEFAIRGIHAVELWLSRFDKTGAFLLRSLGAKLVSEQGFRFRYTLGNGLPGSYLDLLWGQEGAVGIEGKGAIDHVGWTVATESDLWQYHDLLNQQGRPLGPLREQTYYRTFTFRDPEGLLMEMSTSGPGFDLDEAPEKLGREFRVPLWEGFRRQQLLAALPPFEPG